MKNVNLSALVLRARLVVMALGPVFCGACALILIGGAALLWLLPQRALQTQRQQLAMQLATTPAQHKAAAAPASANDNLLLFYDALGEKRYSEQQVKTLFGLAAKAKLTLSQGEYKSGYERSAHLHTYQVTLPVKGSYGDVWQFGMLALRAIPFASLDEMSFKRDSINATEVEARVRMTLYLADKPAGVLP